MEYILYILKDRIVKPKPHSHFHLAFNNTQSLSSCGMGLNLSVSWANGNVPECNIGIFVFC